MANAAIVRIAEYHNDVIASLRLYFSDVSPSFQERFFGRTPEEVSVELTARLEETDLRSALAVFSTVEAAFRADYERRCQARMKDDLSRAFRAIYKVRKKRVGLEQDIFEAWKDEWPGSRQLIGSLRGAFKFRHWLAHGRYWKPRLARKKYDFNSVYDLAAAVFSSLPLCEPD
jgi:hypothetical protein